MSYRDVLNVFNAKVAMPSLKIEKGQAYEITKKS
jgi:hypothetical protein